MPAPSAAEIADRCVTCLVQILGVPRQRIDPRQKFSRLGLDSAMAVSLVLDIETWLGIEIDPEVVYDNPTVEAFATHVAGLCATVAAAK